MNIVNTIVKALQELNKSKTSSYDTTATVTRIEGDTVYVHIPGGVDETPADKTIDAKVGQTVQVRISNSRAFLVGNSSAPPTDDTVANRALSIARKSHKTVAKIYEKVESGEMDGTDARNIVSITTEYCLATDRSIPAGETFDDIQYGDWSEDRPTIPEEGTYFYWRRTVTEFDDGTVIISEPVFDSEGQMSYEAQQASANASTAATSALGIANNAITAANEKKRVFNSTPTPPYDLNDIWFDGAHGKTYLCTTAKGSTGSYSSSDWTEYSQDVSNHFWYDNAGAHVAETSGSVASGNSVTVASTGIVMLLNGKLVTSWTGSSSSDAALNFYDCSNTSASTNNLVASYAKAGTTFYVDNKTRLALTASGMGLYQSDGSTPEALYSSSGVDLYASGVKRTAVDTNGLHVYASDGSTELAVFGSTVRVGTASGRRFVIGSSNAKIMYDDENYVTIGSGGLSMYADDDSVAYFGSSSARIGGTDGAHITLNATSRAFSLNDKDSYSLTLKLDSSHNGIIMVDEGLTLGADGDIDLSTNGDINLSGADLNLSAYHDVTISTGNNYELNLNVGDITVNNYTPIYIDNTLSKTVTISAGAVETLWSYESITKTGYRPVGLVGLAARGTNSSAINFYLAEVDHLRQTLVVYCKNTASSDASITVNASVLYVVDGLV